jgi:hypothetical protein
MRRKTRNVIIFCIIVLSIVSAIKVTGFSLGSPKAQDVNKKDVEKLYKEANNISKSEISYITSDFGKTSSEFNRIINREGVRKLYYVREKGSLVALVDIPNESTPEVLNELRNLSGLDHEKIETAPLANSELIDAKSHIDQNKMILKRFTDRMSNPHLTTREIGELQSSIRQIQTKIDSLSNLHNVEQARQNQLVMATVQQIAKSSDSTQLRRVTKLAQWSFINFIVLAVAAVLIYFAYNLLFGLSKMLGIKSSTGSAGYGYTYGKSYGYGNKSEKKRKYVRKEHSSDSKESERDKSN